MNEVRAPVANITGSSCELAVLGSRVIGVNYPLGLKLLSGSREKSVTGEWGLDPSPCSDELVLWDLIPNRIC